MSTTTQEFFDLPELACADVGGVALLCNDEFFAEKENLLRPQEAQWREGVYTDRGKWMDGWETRRRREAGYDWCIIRLGMPGTIHGVVVDTAFFRGNFPAECSIEACELETSLDLTALASASWTEILPRSGLAGNTKNAFTIGGATGAAQRRFTHLRLNIFPDGGVARLRVYGQVVPSWSRLRAHGGPIDLAALEHGAWVESCSDMFFGSRNNLIMPGRPVTMADGWETKRRRGPGHDWAIVRLACAGKLERLELDTTHFRGNAPGRCVVEGCVLPVGSSPSVETSWRELLSSPLQPHTRHFFEDELRRIGAVTHLRLNVFPDGGVARMRAWGLPESTPEPGLLRLNSLGAAEAQATLLRCCGSSSWASQLAALRPFEDVPALLRQAERVFWQLAPSDWLDAYAAHPRIGDRGGSAWSSKEQQGAAKADPLTLTELSVANQSYVDRFGFIYIVCASGRSGPQMLADLRQRLTHTPEQELRTAAEEQAKITRLRLGKLLQELALSTSEAS